MSQNIMNEFLNTEIQKNTTLLEFSQLVVGHALNEKKGLVPLFSNQFLFQKKALEYLINYCQLHYPGFVIWKDNKYPHDDLKSLDIFLKPHTIIIINQISNSYQYSEILELAKTHFIIAGFECFSSPTVAFQSFLQRFEMISRIDCDTIQQHVLSSLLCYKNNENENSDLKYNLFKNI